MGEAYRRREGTPVVPPGPSTVDLHSHSDRSDGLLAPETLAAAAAAAGVRLLALTDHDTLAGIRLLRAAALPEGLALLPGVEINSVASGVADLWEGELHILGLGVDPDDEAFEAALAGQRHERAARFRRIADRLRGLGLPIDDQLADLAHEAGASLGRPTLARALVAAGHATDADDAMQRLLARGKPGYESRVGMGPAEAIRAIRAAGGLPVLAHFADAPGRLALVRELIDLGLGGLEVYYRRFPQETVDALAAVAADLRLVPTGGSDYHGDGVSYAAAHAQLWVPPEVGEGITAILNGR